MLPRLMMTVRKLLKSWATPPHRVPRTSRFLSLAELILEPHLRGDVAHETQANSLPPNWIQVAIISTEIRLPSLHSCT